MTTWTGRPESALARIWVAAVATLLGMSCGRGPTVDLLLVGGTVYDGSGGEPFAADVGVTGDQIVFMGDAEEASVSAVETVDVTGLWVSSGFIDMHSHWELEEDYGRDGEPFLYQGITTAVVGVDGGGTTDVAALFQRLAESGIGLNALTYVGHGAVRRAVLGLEDRAPSPAELDSMKALVRKAMEEGALGLSSGLFYVPGYYADTEEVVELAGVAAAHEGIYDTHDRDLGATHQGIGYLASIREGIRIGEESGARVIFSHFNAQGAHNYGRAAEGAALIDSARARGIDVQAAQHVYTATQSSLGAYAIPRWAAAGGQDAMVARFDDPQASRRLDVQTTEMLAIRGGAGKIQFADPRPDLNGRTLADVATEWHLPVPEAVRRILRDGNVAVMNRDLYDAENTRYLATRPWMMTCTDGRTPRPETVITHPRAFGAFTKKIRDYVLDEGTISMAFAVRSMTGLAADFLRLEDRGYVAEGMRADLTVLDPDRIRDRATYQAPRLLAEGTMHVLVNGAFAIRDGELTATLAGRPLGRRGVPAT